MILKHLVVCTHWPLYDLANSGFSCDQFDGTGFSGQSSLSSSSLPVFMLNFLRLTEPEEAVPMADMDFTSAKKPPANVLRGVAASTVPQEELKIVFLEKSFR